MKRKREPSTESAEQEDDQEMEEDDEEEQESEDNSAGEDGDQEESGDESEESDSPPVELMVTTRERRANAGSKMAKLLHSSIQEDDFYSGAYEGGFKDDDVDDAYVSPVSDEDDEVDSDFDRPEEEDEPASDHEEKEKRPKKKKTLYKEPKQKPDLDVFSMNKKWAIDKVDRVLHNECDARTQAQRMKEAEKTERENAASLNRFEEFEIEKRKRREKALKHGLNGPYMSMKSTPTGNVLVLPKIKQFEAPHMPPTMVCAVTGQRAKYRDTVTGLPYANASAFAEIRAQYEEFLRGIKGNPEVDEYLERLDKELEDESNSDDDDDVSESS